MAAAAIFDLDRTLLAGSSGPVFAEELRRAGVLKGQATAFERMLFALFDTIGENRPSMMLTKQGVRFTAGWDRRAVALAGRRAAARLAEQLQPYARAVIDSHRKANHLLVLATTSPHDLAEPLRRRLGFDAVVASRYGHRGSTFDGTLRGPFVWGTGKREAVAEWALAHDVDMGESFAYSDSYYDLPLLAAVGHPVAVNPDPRLELAARVRGWPIRHLDCPAGVPKIAGVEPLRALSAVARPELFRFARFEFVGLDSVPEHGPAIIAANHRSYFDPVALTLALAKRGRVARFLAKKELFDAPIVGAVMSAVGGIPVERGSGSDEPLLAAEVALGAGEVVVILPEGTIPRGDAARSGQLKGKRGVAVLARRSQAPVIPIGLWGTELVWPRTSPVPHVWNVLRRPTVHVRCGPPVKLNRRNDAADLEKTIAAIAKLLPFVAEDRDDAAVDLAVARSRRAAAAV